MNEDEGSFKRFEELLKKTENFSRQLSAGDIAACKFSFKQSFD
jgi:iron uptake system EfeUOB component EfeO/EfeM